MLTQNLGESLARRETACEGEWNVFLGPKAACRIVLTCSRDSHARFNTSRGRDYRLGAGKDFRVRGGEGQGGGGGCEKSFWEKTLVREHSPWKASTRLRGENKFHVKSNLAKLAGDSKTDAAPVNGHA